MSYQRERPARADGANAKVSGDVADESSIAAVPVQLRRRRAASYRLPTLPDGRRDPLDPEDGLDYDQPRNLAALSRAVDHLRELGLDVGDLVPDEAREAWPRHARDVQTELRLGVVL